MTDIKAFGFADDVAFTRYLVQEIGVAAVPGSSFYFTKGLGRGLVRWAFAKKLETLEAVAGRLKKKDEG